MQQIRSRQTQYDEQAARIKVYVSESAGKYAATCMRCKKPARVTVLTRHLRRLAAKALGAQLDPLHAAAGLKQAGQRMARRVLRAENSQWYSATGKKPHAEATTGQHDNRKLLRQVCKHASCGDGRTTQ